MHECLSVKIHTKYILYVLYCTFQPIYSIIETILVSPYHLILGFLGIIGVIDVLLLRIY